MADSEHIEVAKAYVTIVPSMEGSQKIIAEELGASGKDAAKSAGEETGKELGNSIATGLKTTAAVIAGAMAAVAGAAVAAGKAFIDSANDVAAWGDQVDKESQKMNMSAAGYQEWSFILEHAGASIEGMKNSMKKLTVAAEEGNDAFTALGISQEQLASMTPEETWNATIAALQNVADEGERTALASELLGKGAVELAPLFNMTAEETAALKDQVYELGGVMSDDAVKAAAEYQDQLQNMQTSLKGLKNNIMSQFLPGLSSVMSGLGKLFSGNGGLEEIRAGLADITSNLADLAPQFVELASAIVMSLLDAFGHLLHLGVKLLRRPRGSDPFAASCNHSGDHVVDADRLPVPAPHHVEPHYFDHGPRDMARIRGQCEDILERDRAARDRSGQADRHGPPDITPRHRLDHLRSGHHYHHPREHRAHP